MFLLASICKNTASCLEGNDIDLYCKLFKKWGLIFSLLQKQGKDFSTTEHQEFWHSSTPLVMYWEHRKCWRMKGNVILSQMFQVDFFGKKVYCKVKGHKSRIPCFHPDPYPLRTTVLNDDNLTWCIISVKIGSGSGRLMASSISNSTDCNSMLSCGSIQQCSTV